MDGVQRLLDEHGANVMAQIQQMLPAYNAAPEGDGLEIAALTQALSERDREAQALEDRLNELQNELLAKDRCVAQLGGDLDATVREVRHKQLDLEFQQLKLEERVRSNAEFEQVQRSLAAQVADASLNARHAALDVDMGVSTPRTIRAQGSLPWTLRSKGRLPVTPR